MAEKLRARVVRVKSDRHGGALAVAAAISDQTLQVKDAGDFTAPGTLLVDDDAGTLLDYTAVTFVEDADPSDLATPDAISLAAPLAVAIPVETALFVYEAPDDSTDDEETQVADVYAVCVPEDDEDAVETGEPIDAVVPPHLQDDLPLGARPGNGVPVVLEWDDDAEEWLVARFRGKGTRGQAYEADDVRTITAAEVTAGAATVTLSHRPIAESIKLWWRSVWQPPTEYVVDILAQTVTVPLGTFAQAGDQLRVHYAYRRGVPKVVRLPEVIGFSVVGNNMGHGFNWTSIGWPVGALATDLFVFAQLARTSATNTCTDTRATLAASGAQGLDTANVWVGKVTNPATPLVASATDLGGVQEDVYGLLVLRPDSPIDFDLTRVGDSGSQSAGAGSIPALSGSGSGGVGVGFSSAGIGGTSPHNWPGTWPGYVDNGNYGRISFVTNSSPVIGSVPTLSSVDGWRGFTLGLTEG